MWESRKARKSEKNEDLKVKSDTSFLIRTFIISFISPIDVFEKGKANWWSRRNAIYAGSYRPILKIVCFISAEMIKIRTGGFKNSQFEE